MEFTYIILVNVQQKERLFDIQQANRQRDRQTARDHVREHKYARVIFGIFTVKNTKKTFPHITMP